jgi:hypothetical protein
MWMALFGGKYLKIYQMKWGKKTIEIELMRDFGVFSDWILDVAWHRETDHQV